VSRSLVVYLNDRRIGELQENNDLWAFEYDADWSADESAFDLSPALPRRQTEHLDGATLRPVQWYFDNLLPEERLREAVSREANIHAEDAFALLEYLGAESAGSLTLLPAGQPLPQQTGLRPLPDEELSRRIARLPRATLSAEAPKRMSIAGARHKLLVVLQDGKLFEPIGATPSTHILKPDHPSADYPASAANEYVTMRLARAFGLELDATAGLVVDLTGGVVTPGITLEAEDIVTEATYLEPVPNSGEALLAGMPALMQTAISSLLGGDLLGTFAIPAMYGITASDLRLFAEGDGEWLGLYAGIDSSAAVPMEVDLASACSGGGCEGGCEEGCGGDGGCEEGCAGSCDQARKHPGAAAGRVAMGLGALLWLGWRRSR